MSDQPRHDQTGRDRDLAAELRLHPERRPVTRLSRKVVLGLAAVTALAVSGALIWTQRVDTHPFARITGAPDGAAVRSITAPDARKSASARSNMRPTASGVTDGLSTAAQRRMSSTISRPEKLLESIASS